MLSVHQQSVTRIGGEATPPPPTGAGGKIMELNDFQKYLLEQAYRNFAHYILKRKEIAKIFLDYSYALPQDILDNMKARGEKLAAEAFNHEVWLKGFAAGAYLADDDTADYDIMIDNINIIKSDPNNWYMANCSDNFRDILFDALNKFAVCNLELDPDTIEIPINGLEPHDAYDMIADFLPQEGYRWWTNQCDIEDD